MNFWKTSAKMDDHKIKIAIPAYDGKIMDHVGICPFYIIYTVGFGNIIKEETFTVPDNSLNCANIALLLAQKGVQILLAGKIETEEIELLIFHGIKVYFNCAGSVNEVVKIFLEGELADLEWKENGFSKNSNN